MTTESTNCFSGSTDAYKALNFIIEGRSCTLSHLLQHDTCICYEIKSTRHNMQNIMSCWQQTKQTN